MLEVFVDGAAAGNPGPSGIGVYIKGEGHQLRFSQPIGLSTNHHAEFRALLYGLQEAKKLTTGIVSVKTDSKIVADSIEKEYVKDPTLSKMLDDILLLAQSFEYFFVKWIRDSENKTADLLARSAIQHNSNL